MAARNAGGAAANRTGMDGRPALDADNSVEFVVKPSEDLVLEGSHKTLLRVRANTPYSCIMMKSQRFASLFRHYAKHHGLDKDTLVFSFTEELQNEDTPESVHMQRNDEIVVRRRRAPKPHAFPAPDDAGFFAQFRALLLEEEHADVAFVVGAGKEHVPAHRAVLTARSDFFRALFRKGGMRESEEGLVAVESATVPTIKRMLEWVYTNRVEGLSGCTPTEVIDLLGTAEMYLLSGLKALCEATAGSPSLLDTESCGKLLAAAERLGCPALKERCVEYLLAHAEEVTSHPSFQRELLAMPSLSIPIVKAAASSSAASSAIVGGGTPCRGGKRKRDED